MPPFRLDVIKYDPRDRIAPKIFHCQKQFNEKVKITNWDMHLNNKPYDMNPYNPQCYNLHTSHYDRLGATSDDYAHHTSETHDSLEKTMEHRAILMQTPNDPHKFLVNAYSIENVPFYAKPKPPCPVTSQEYISTMQSSYGSPYPYDIGRLVMPVVGEENKRWAQQIETKFLDDNFRCFTQGLQRVKGFRHRGMNPITGMNGDECE